MTNVYLSNIHYSGQKEVKTFQVEGTVTDAEGNPLENAQVSLEGTTAKTDASGKVSMVYEGVSGDHTVTVRKSGYVTNEIPVTVDDDETKVTSFTAKLEKLATKKISSDQMDVVIAEKFPSVAWYEMKEIWQERYSTDSRRALTSLRSMGNQ